MEKWLELGKRLEGFLRPATFPVAVRFLEPGDEPLEKAKRPVDATGCPISICQGLTLTRTRGQTLIFDKEECSCPLATSAYGWDESFDPSFVTTFLQVMNYARDAESAMSRVRNMAKLEPGKYTSLILSPLTRTRIEPHLVLVYGNPAQIMRLVHAVARSTGETVSAGFGGIAGSCNEGIARTFLEDIPRVALPGNGDRVFAVTRDDEIIFSFPAHFADEIIEGLEATSERGVRYPIPTFIDYRLPFSDLMNRFGG
ncbi:MAG: DUF169 domain-containing protein [Actinomycetota bacterium]|nr:DUF169 domain-containing protein [Actinomycetota bacterium]